MAPRIHEFQHYLVGEMVEHYQAGDLTRRDLLRRALLITGSVPAAALALTAAGCTTPATTPPATTPAPAVAASSAATVVPTTAPTAAPPPAATAAAATTLVPAGVPPARTESGITVPNTTPGLETLNWTFPVPAGYRMITYLAHPASGGPFPGVVIIHENRGLVGEHYKDVARRFATHGYAALAIDLLSPRGGTVSFDDAAAATGALGQISPDEHVATVKAAIDYWTGTTDVVRKDVLAMTGYCFGGGVTWRTITQEPRIKAAAPYYGPNPPLEAVPNIQAQVLGVYGGTDTRINAGIPALEAALAAAGIRSELVVYEGAGHAFFNDTSAAYNPVAARAAWDATIGLFDRVLKA